VTYDAAKFLFGLFCPHEQSVTSPIGPNDLPADWRFCWEERAAIMEYDGGLTKDEADAAALADILAAMRRQESHRRAA
jgi:hypothetical protein